MKKLLLASLPILFAVLTVNVGAQSSFSITDNNLAAVANGSTIVYYVDQATAIETHDFEVHNNNPNALTAKVRKAIQSQQTGQTFYFCTDQNCYTPTTNLSANVSMNTAGSFQLITDFTPYNTTGVSLVRYSAFDVNNPSDSVYFFIEYHVSPTGIASHSNVKANIGSPMPNPASSVFNMTYNLGSSFGTGEAKLVIYNMLGAVVKSETLADAEGTIKTDVSTLENGVYFASLEVNGKQISTKRIVVTH